MSDKQFAVFVREGLLESVLSDLLTLAVLAFAIWFSREMGGGFWEAVCFAMLILWLSVKLPMETARVVKLRTKADAVAWAQSLPEDQE